VLPHDLDEWIEAWIERRHATRGEEAPDSATEPETPTGSPEAESQRARGRALDHGPGGSVR
jgi:hypothetical protein